MTRRGFFGGLLGVTTICGQHNPASCEWVTGPFYITAASSYEEPDYYPPEVFVKIEHCRKCGIIRLPESLRGFTRRNLAEGKAEGGK